MSSEQIKIFSDLSHPELAKEICQELGLELGKSQIIIFGNGNPLAEVLESVRGQDVFVIGTQAPEACVNFLALNILIDVLHYASARRVTAVIPYLFESRADKKDRPRISIAARLAARFLEIAGAHRVLAMDLHSAQIQGFFRIPMDVLDAAPLICEYLKQRDLGNYALVAGDAGEAKKLDPFLKNLPLLPLAMFDKRRESHDEKPKVVGLIGDISRKIALVLDDEVTSGGMIKEAADFLKTLPLEKQPLELRLAVTHPVLSGRAIPTLNESGIKELIAINTIPVPPEKIRAAQFAINILSPAKLFAKAIKLIHQEESVSQLWNNF